MTRLQRFGAFNVVGLLGIGVQLAVLWALAGGLHLHYLVATIVATEAAILHNFAWHCRWTWRDRLASPRACLAALVRFHVTNGLVSLVGNAALMMALTGRLGIPYLPANLLAIAACSLVNFLAGDGYVFRASCSVTGPRLR